MTCDPVAPGESVCAGASVVGAVTVGVEVETVTVTGAVGVVTGGAAALLLKTPAAARTAKKRARRDAAMIASCLAVRIRPAMTISRRPWGWAPSSSGSTQTSSASSYTPRALLAVSVSGSGSSNQSS